MAEPRPWKGVLGRVVFWIALGLAVVSVPVFALMGRDAVLDSRSGSAIEPVTDPSAPNYEVILAPTPTMLVVHLEQDELVSVAFLALSGPETGAGMLLPATLVFLHDEGPRTLAAAWRDEGEAGLVNGVEKVLGVGVGEYAGDGRRLDGDVVVLDASGWGQLIAPVAPIRIENLDELVHREDGRTVVDFAAGPLDLESDRVGEYLAARNEGENDLNRLARQRAFWEAWIDVVRRSTDPDAIPGEADAGLGRFLRAFAEGQAGIAVLPAAAVRIPGADDDVFQADDDVLAPNVAAMVPFPASPQPGERFSVRVLDGTGTDGAAFDAARRLASAGGTIRSLGNGPSFDYVGTQVLYYDAVDLATAEHVVEVLGGGSVEFRDQPDEVVAITVVLGRDVVGAAAP